MTKLRLSLPLKISIAACTALATFALGMTMHETYVHYHPAYLDLPANKPMIGRPEMLGSEPGGDQEHSTLAIPLCDRSPYPLNVSIKVLGDAAEVSWIMSGCTQASGGDCWVGIARLSRQRKKPVYVYLDWRRGPKSGKEMFMISPQEDNTIH